MQMAMKVTLVFCASFAALVSVSSHAHAALMVYLTRPQLVSMSDVVVRANVGEQAFRAIPDGARVVTRTVLYVHEYVSGTGPEQLVLEQLGGRLGDTTIVSDGEPPLTYGEEVVLFLRRGPGSDVYLSAMAQSAYYVVRGRVARDLTHLTFRTFLDGALVPYAPPPEPVETLSALVADIGRIRAAAAVKP